MIIIHDVKTLPRLVETALAERLRVLPAVVLTGARQTGKSTLVSERIAGQRRYASLDDFDVLDAARRDPEALVGGSQPVTLDEVQREPLLMAAVKLADLHIVPSVRFLAYLPLRYAWRASPDMQRRCRHFGSLLSGESRLNFCDEKLLGCRGVQTHELDACDGNEQSIYVAVPNLIREARRCSA